MTPTPEAEPNPAGAYVVFVGETPPTIEVEDEANRIFEQFYPDFEQIAANLPAGTALAIPMQDQTGITIPGELPPVPESDEEQDPSDG